MPTFFQNAKSFAAGAAMNLVMTEVAAIREPSGNLAQDPITRQLMPATMGLALLVGGALNQNSAQASLGAGLLCAVALRVVTGCYNMASYYGESSSRPMSMTM